MVLFSLEYGSVVLHCDNIQFLEVLELLLIGNLCHGDKFFVPLGVEVLHVVLLQLDSQWIIEVKKSFTCSTDLEVVTDHESNLFCLSGIDCPVVCLFAFPCRFAS